MQCLGHLEQQLGRLAESQSFRGQMIGKGDTLDEVANQVRLTLVLSDVMDTDDRMMP